MLQQERQREEERRRAAVQTKQQPRPALPARGPDGNALQVPLGISSFCRTPP